MKWLIFLISILFISLVSTSTIVAQTTEIKASASPNAVNYNTEPVTIKINNIPKSTEGTVFKLTIYKNGTSGTEITATEITSGRDGCAINAGSGWKGNPTCTDAGSSLYTFTGKLDTTQLQFNPNSQDGIDGVLYDTWITGGRLPPIGVHATFFINPTQNKAPFSITRVDTDTTTNISTVKPGDSLRVWVKDAKADKQYRFGIEGRDDVKFQENLNCNRLDGMKDPPRNTCLFAIDVPADMRNYLTIFITDPETNKTAKRRLPIVTNVDPLPTSGVLSITPVPTNTPSPTPSATPTPPHPPCPTQYTVHGDNGEFTGCTALFTGLGIEVKTDPTQFISNVFALLLSISGGILLLLIIYSGYQLMTSQGNPEKIQAARERITSAIVGFLFLVFSMVILEAIGVDILRIPGFEGGSSTSMPRPGPTGAFPTARPTPKKANNCGEKNKKPCDSLYYYTQNKGCKNNLKLNGGVCS